MVSSLTWWSKCHLKGTDIESKALWEWRKAQSISAIHLWEIEYLWNTSCVCVFLSVYIRMFCVGRQPFGELSSSCFTSRSHMWSTWPSWQLSTTTFGMMISVQYVNGSSPADHQARAGLHNRFSVSLQPRWSIKMMCEGQSSHDQHSCHISSQHPLG